MQILAMGRSFRRGFESNLNRVRSAAKRVLVALRCDRPLERKRSTVIGRRSRTDSPPVELSTDSRGRLCVVVRRVCFRSVSVRAFLVGRRRRDGESNAGVRTISLLRQITCATFCPRSGSSARKRKHVATQDATPRPTSRGYRTSLPASHCLFATCDASPFPRRRRATTLGTIEVRLSPEN